MTYQSVIVTNFTESPPGVHAPEQVTCLELRREALRGAMDTRVSHSYSSRRDAWKTVCCNTDEGCGDVMQDPL